MKGRIYSVFVSSTFEDMHFERDYLQLYVFPEINEELRKHSISLQIIDLRGGIKKDETTESVEENVMKVCFDEIDRSRPFFIGLLGNRYGWIPPKEYDAFGKNRGVNIGISITSMEIEYGFLLQDSTIRCLFMERDAKSLDDMEPEIRELYDDAYSTDKTIKSENPQKIKELKETIKRKLQESGRTDCYQEYRPVWKNGRFEELTDFGKKVKQAILKDVESLIKKAQDENPFSLENVLQEHYIDMKLSGGYPRTTVVNHLTDTIEHKSGLMTISGKSGSGKSCIYAILVDYFRKLTDDYIVLVHSTAIGSECRDYGQMLQRWNYQLETVLGLSHKETTSVNDATYYFSQLIKQIPNGKKLLMFIDAINGFNRSAIADYLSFYPRNISDKRLMICTALPEYVDRIAHYHRSLENYTMPALQHDEVASIINGISDYYHKDLSSLNRLLCQDPNGILCNKSPLWLTIATLRIICFNKQDFDQIKQIDTQFNDGIYKYISTLVNQFPEKENELFSELLRHLDGIYSSMPSLIFKLLSVSYDGLNEETMAALMGDKWLALTFASIKAFLKDFIAEQSDSKAWKIMYNTCRLQLDETEHQKICCQLASYYIENLQRGKLVTDNVSYYVMQCNDEAIFTGYKNLFYNQRSRYINELVQICETVDYANVSNFLYSEFTKRQGVNRLLPKSIICWEIKEIVAEIVKHFNYCGKYENTIRITDEFLAFIKMQNFNRDIKSLICVLIDNYRLDAAKMVFSDQELIESYINAKKRAKVVGPLSVIFAPIVQKYYNWEIFKLKTK